SRPRPDPTRAMNEPVKIESSFEVPFSRAELWPALSRVDWMQESLGLPPVAHSLRALPTGGVELFGKGRFLGLRLGWQELPFEWLEEEFFRGHWLFDEGPFAEALFGMEFRSKDA